MLVPLHKLQSTHMDAQTRVLILAFTSPIGLHFCRVWHYRQKEKADNIYLRQTSEPSWLTLLSAASQEVFQHSCLGAVGQTDRGFPTNTHRTLAGPDWKPDTLSFLPASISSIAQNTLLLCVHNLVPQNTTQKPHWYAEDLLISSFFFLCNGCDLHSKSILHLVFFL